MDWIALRPHHFASCSCTHIGLWDHCATAPCVPTKYNTCDTHAYSGALHARTFSRLARAHFPALSHLAPAQLPALHIYHCAIIPTLTRSLPNNLSIIHALHMRHSCVFSRLALAHTHFPVLSHLAPAQLPAIHVYHHTIIPALAHSSPNNPSIVHASHLHTITQNPHHTCTEWGHSEFKSLGDVRNNASHRVIWHFSLGNTWHELAAPLWVLSAAIPIWGAAFPRNARHARTLPALHDACTLPALHDACAFPRLKRPIVPAIQKHPSTVRQAL